MARICISIQPKKENKQEDGNKDKKNSKIASALKPVIARYNHLERIEQTEKQQQKSKSKRANKSKSQSKHQNENGNINNTKNKHKYKNKFMGTHSSTLQQQFS